MGDEGGTRGATDKNKNQENQGTTKQTNNQQDAFGKTIISTSVLAGLELKWPHQTGGVPLPYSSTFKTIQNWWWQGYHVDLFNRQTWFSHFVALFVVFFLIVLLSFKQQPYEKPVSTSSILHFKTNKQTKTKDECAKCWLQHSHFGGT